MDKNTAKALDKYYTNDDVASECYELFESVIHPQALIVEPSAGAGAFLRASEDREIVGLDIHPEQENIVRHDFLLDPLSNHVDMTRDIVFLGNPPFGRKGDVAVNFINTALNYGSFVGFVLPIQFRKWSAQKRIVESAKLIIDHDLKSSSFSFLNQPYDLRCSFQVWARDSHMPDFRIRKSPPTAHVDFSMWQFNRTVEAEKYFDYDWDFAVPRQGFNDYSKKALSQNDCDRKKQWIFFKAHSSVVFDRLMNIDFDALSKLNSGIPGFGKADVVKKYCEMFESDSIKGL